VPAFYPGLDIAVAAFFLQNPPFHVTNWLWVEWINEYTALIFRGLAPLCLVIWAVLSLKSKWRRWAYPVAFVGLAVFLGPGLLTGVLKENWQRARPFHVVQFGGSLRHWFNRINAMTTARLSAAMWPAGFSLPA
jgi:hypothetical protein